MYAFRAALLIMIFYMESSQLKELDYSFEQCAIEEDGVACEGTNRTDFYSKDHRVESIDILRKINLAKQVFIPCPPDDSSCSCFEKNLKRDLKILRQIGSITQEHMKAAANYGTRYKFFRKKLYREESCMFPARCSGIEHFLQPLASRLGDMDLVINTRDYPQIHDGRAVLPVFSFSKTKSYRDILYPAWSFWSGGPAIRLHPTGIGRWDLHRGQIAKAGNKTAWHKKMSVGFFRGSRTSDERDNLVLLSRQLPDLVDAQYTKNQAWKSLKDTLFMEPAEEVSFEEHCRYKYLFNFRGVAASFRLKHLFLCKSLIFHVGDEWNEFFYSAMKPWVHYVPVQSYPTKEALQFLIQFFREHDKVAQEIAERGFNFIWNHLRMEDVQCYWEKLLRAYQEFLHYEVVAEEAMIEIKAID